MNLTFEQSLFVRTSAINIQTCSRSELEGLFIELLTLKLVTENTYNALIKDSINSDFNYLEATRS